MENWKEVVGYEGLYEVSDFGNVRSVRWRGSNRVKNLYLKKQNRGYYAVELSNGVSRKTFLVHRLVAEAFVKNPHGLPLINHIDENKRNNRAENLEWCTQSENMVRYMDNHGSSKPISRTEAINQLDKEGCFIKTWPNANTIKKSIGYHPTSIQRCCEGIQHTAYGYRWQYATSNIIE